jgi:hypothetical protein
MAKYKIEGAINFYEELYKSLDIDDEEQKTEEDNNKCLITNQPLIDKYITMMCGHKFNYIPLFNDLVNHKKKFNIMEGSNKLQNNQIRCPYCRKKQSELIPYYEELGLQKINGVNYFDPNIKTNYIQNYNSNQEICKFKQPNPNFDETKPETDTNKKYLYCFNYYTSKISIYNNENPHQPINYNDDNCYCYYHKKIMIKKYKTEEKNKAKEDIKAAKLKAKEEIKAEKLKAKEEAKLYKELVKQQIKEQKNKGKEAAIIIKKKPVENVVIGISQINLEDEIIQNDKIFEGCLQILKTGPNKGKHCGCKVSKENLCLRHFKIVNNIIINN